MTMQLFQKKIGRRTFLGATAAGAAAVGGLAPMPAAAATRTVRIGFLAPLTGEVAAWGLPGLYGCQIWAEKVNAAGGVRIGDDVCTFEFVSTTTSTRRRRRAPGPRSSSSKTTSSSS